MKNPFAYARAGLLAIASLAAMVMSASAADIEDPIALFAKLVPVFSHDRCTGCHGRVNPELATGNNHSMGQFTDSRDCMDCHNDSPGWRTRPDMRFFNKDAKQLCQMQSVFVNAIRRAGASVAQANALYLKHLAQDPLIGTAYIGKRGGATGQADPPGMRRDDFVTAAGAWLKAGAGCGGWEGEISQKETFGSNYTFPMPGPVAPSSVHVNETAARDFKIDRANGTTTANVTASGQGVIVLTLHMNGPSGPCTSVQTTDSSWTTSTPGNAGGTLDIRIANDGSYTIRFSGPVEKTNGNTTNNERNDCGVSFPPSLLSPPIELTWNPWRFTIRCPNSYGICQLYDLDNKRLSGTMTRTIVDHSDSGDPQTWLLRSPASTARADDGSTIPVTVTTTWDLTLEN